MFRDSRKETYSRSDTAAGGPLKPKQCFFRTVIAVESISFSGGLLQTRVRGVCLVVHGVRRQRFPRSPVNISSLFGQTLVKKLNFALLSTLCPTLAKLC